MVKKGVKTEISIVLAGAAGQGVQTVEQLLVSILKIAGCHVFATKEYMSRVRGGINTTEVRAGAKRVAAYVDRIDLLVALNKGAVEHLKSRITANTTIIGDPNNIHGCADCKTIEIPFSEIATEVGDKIFESVVAVGVLAGLLAIETNIAENYIKERFANKSLEISEKNIIAFNKGYSLGSEFANVSETTLNLTATAKDELIFNGSETIGFGAIAGGCNFISAYPMSPSTGAFTILSKYSKEFEIVIDEAEDEIAAINKGIGAWYTGARALVSTSGGGYDLMTEGISLAGIIESPIVIHLAQRPGPATGLPTRTAQEDLNLALYAGHGEFPRIILTPGTLKQGLMLTQQAFNLSDKFQVPVFVLTDQYFVDSYYNTPDFDITTNMVEKHIIKTNSNYKRYSYTDSGISPRGIPGYGEGLVGLDSDEHDEAGHITEDVNEIRIKMVQKRNNKLEAMKSEAIAPELVGNVNYSILVITWGSNYHVAKEALENLARKDVAMLHFSQVYPLPIIVNEYFKQAKKIISLENNFTGQFTQLLQREFGINIHEKLLKYNGIAFSVEEVQQFLSTL